MSQYIATRRCKLASSPANSTGFFDPKGSGIGRLAGAGRVDRATACKSIRRGMGRTSCGMKLSSPLGLTPDLVESIAAWSWTASVTSSKLYVGIQVRAFRVRTRGSSWMASMHWSTESSIEYPDPLLAGDDAWRREQILGHYAR